MGIALYELTYFIIHDLFIHQRIQGLSQPQITYLNAIKKAHEAHHKAPENTPGTCFGMLFFPWKYYIEAKKRLS